LLLQLLVGLLGLRLENHGGNDQFGNHSAVRHTGVAVGFIGDVKCAAETLMRTLKSVPVGIAIAQLSFGVLIGSAEPQRTRQSNRAYEIPRALAGVLLPESLQTILVMHLARDITKAQAGELEADLKKKPENLEDRLKLIGYYSWNGQTENDRQRLRTHVVWVIENRPDHPAAGEAMLRDLPDDNEGNTIILNLWNENLDKRSDDRGVLKNAEKFFFGKDPLRAEQIIHRLAESEPSNPEWPKELASLYRMVGVPGFETNNSAERALEAYKRVLSVTRDPAAREGLAGEMADAEFKSGDFDAASELAQLHLKSSDRSAVHRANILLGRISLRWGDLIGAKQFLLDSSKPEAAAYVRLFSPSMVLAKELLAKGEQETVIQYLTNCQSLWPRGEEILSLWIEDLRHGRTPDFGNLAK
jgi:hypothetical protein